MCFPRSRLQFGASGLRHLPHRKPALAPVLQGCNVGLPAQARVRVAGWGIREMGKGEGVGIWSMTLIFLPECRCKLEIWVSVGGGE